MNLNKKLPNKILANQIHMYHLPQSSWLYNRDAGLFQHTQVKTCTTSNIWILGEKSHHNKKIKYDREVNSNDIYASNSTLTCITITCTERDGEREKKRERERERETDTVNKILHFISNCFTLTGLQKLSIDKPCGNGIEFS